MLGSSEGFRVGFLLGLMDPPEEPAEEYGAAPAVAEESEWRRALGTPPEDWPEAWRRRWPDTYAHQVTYWEQVVRGRR